MTKQEGNEEDIEVLTIDEEEVEEVVVMLVEDEQMEEAELMTVEVEHTEVEVEEEVKEEEFGDILLSQTYSERQLDEEVEVESVVLDGDSWSMEAVVTTWEKDTYTTPNPNITPTPTHFEMEHQYTLTKVQ